MKSEKWRVEIREEMTSGALPELLRLSRSGREASSSTSLESLPSLLSVRLPSSVSSIPRSPLIVRLSSGTECRWLAFGFARCRMCHREPPAQALHETCDVPTADSEKVDAQQAMPAMFCGRRGSRREKERRPENPLGRMWSS